MRKKLFSSVIVALALLVGIPATSLAANDDHSYVKVHVYKKVINLSNGEEQKSVNLDSWIQQILKNCNIDWKYIDKQKPTEKQQPEPEKQQPAPDQNKEPQQPVNEEKPAPEKEPVQEQPTPAPQQPVNEPVKEKQPSEQQGYQLNQFEQQVVELTNQERAKAGLSPLKVDLELSRVARIKSQDMRDQGYFNHNSPTYGSPFDMMRNFGISYRTAGENIAMGQRSPQEVVNAWMNSDGHRRNILNPNFTHIGVGYVADGNYWTQQFIGK